MPFCRFNKPILYLAVSLEAGLWKQGVLLYVRICLIYSCESWQNDCLQHQINNTCNYTVCTCWPSRVSILIAIFLLTVRVQTYISWEVQTVKASPKHAYTIWNIKPMTRFLYFLIKRDWNANCAYLRNNFTSPWLLAACAVVHWLKSGIERPFAKWDDSQGMMPVLHNKPE